VIATEHLFWITSRAAGGAALILASAAVAVGLMISAKRPVASKNDLRAIHEALSLTMLAMVALHGLSLLGDSFLGAGSDAAQAWFLLIAGVVVLPAAALLALRHLDRWWSAPVAPRFPDRA
jgi:hypothetical protein